MSARQLRISCTADIPAKIVSYKGKKISLVLKNNEVHYGYLENLSLDSLSIINLSRKKFTFPLSSIYEVLIEITEDAYPANH
jgi:hypothetical protein